MEFLLFPEGDYHLTLGIRNRPNISDQLKKLQFESDTFYLNKTWILYYKQCTRTRNTVFYKYRGPVFLLPEDGIISDIDLEAIQSYSDSIFTKGKRPLSPASSP
jgi:hypothetical protein